MGAVRDEENERKEASSSEHLAVSSRGPSCSRFGFSWGMGRTLHGHESDLKPTGTTRVDAARCGSSLGWIGIVLPNGWSVLKSPLITCPGTSIRFVVEFKPETDARTICRGCSNGCDL